MAERAPRTARPRPPVSIDRYALVGHPVQHSWSPFIHGMFARAPLQHLQYRLIDVPPERFRAEALQFFSDGGNLLSSAAPAPLQRVLLPVRDLALLHEMRAGVPAKPLIVAIEARAPSLLDGRAVGDPLLERRYGSVM